jgi:glucose dehydrogenase
MSAANGFLAAVLVVALTILPARAQPGPTQAELDAAAANATEWLHTNHDYGGQRFVDATGINRQNASALQPTCKYDVGDLYPFYTNPIVYRGVMYLTTPSDTIALDAATCALRWRHHWEYKARANWPQSRGAALKDGTIVRGTRDGYLLALAADTGRLLWERQAGAADKGETFTMPPVIFENLVIIGPAGNEVPIKGWVGAFKLKDGDPVWRFNTVPRPGEPGAETWGPTDMPTGGGAVWTPFSLDPAEGLVYVATGNPAPDFFTDVRRGANLYTNSLVVLDARTGKLVWHHQATPDDLHDWDLTQVSPLFRADVGGKPRSLVSLVARRGCCASSTDSLARRSPQSPSRVVRTSKSRSPWKGCTRARACSAVSSGTDPPSAREQTSSTFPRSSGAAPSRRRRRWFTCRARIISAGGTSRIPWTRAGAG